LTIFFETRCTILGIGKCQTDCKIRSSNEMHHGTRNSQHKMTAVINAAAPD